MATRRRIPMVGDHPEPVPVEVLPLRTEVSNSEDAKHFDWSSYSKLLIAALIIPRTVDWLVDYWKANANMLDWAKKVRPDVYEEVRLAFARRRKQLEGGQDG